MDYEVVSLEKAAELIGGDVPVSRATIHRMIAAGVLTARGKGKLRRVLLSSIIAYNTGETVWQNDNDVRPVGTAPSFRTRTGSGGRSFPLETARPAGLVVLTGRKPKPR